MIVKIMFERGYWIVGKRKWWYEGSETRGTHHYFVLDSNIEGVIGKRVAVPINSAMLFILNYDYKKEQKNK